MLKNLSKKVVMFLLCSILLIFNTVPAFASPDVSGDVNTASLATASSNVLVDGSSCTQTITGESLGIFSVNVSDYDLRNLVVSSSVPVKTIIIPASTGLENWINFNSGEYRMFNMIGWHFMPGSQYYVLVTPQTTASVTVSMSKSTSVLTWVNVGSTTVSEQNILMGGQIEQYGIAFQTTGTYRIRVSSVSKLTATFCDALKPSQNKVVSLNGNGYPFEPLEITATGQVQNNYVLILNSNDPINSGGGYTVTIERLY